MAMPARAAQVGALEEDEMRYHRYTLPSLNYTVCTDGDIQQVG